MVTIVGKTWDLHVEEVLGVSLDENLRMIADSVAFCALQVPELVYDAEHFFDGFERRNPDYALRCGGRRCRRARPRSSSATPTAARCPTQVAEAVEARRRRAQERPWEFTPIMTRARGRQSRSPP